MSKTVLRGLAARPLRTVLTMFAILLGVALVSAAFTLTDTMRAASSSLSASAYDETDAVVTAGTAFDADAWVAKRSTIDASVLEDVRSTSGVTAAAGDVTDEAKIIGEDGKPLGTGPYFGVGLDAGAKGVEQLTPFRLQDGRWAAGPGEVVHDAASVEKEEWKVGDTVEIATRGEARDFEVVGVATFGAVKSLGPATAAVFDLAAAQQLFDKQGRYDAVLVAGDDRVGSAMTCTASTSSSQSSGSCCWSSAASPSWSARSRSTTRCPSRWRSARRSWARCGWSGPHAARCCVASCSRRPCSGWSPRRSASSPAWGSPRACRRY
jgi:putative ABC transport system permease protein